MPSRTQPDLFTAAKKAKRIALAVLASFYFLYLLPATFADQSANGPALWRVQDEDSTIWLFGTVHMLNPHLKWQTKTVMAAFEEADTLYIEAPVVDATPAVMQPLIMKHGMNQNRPPFLNDLSPEGRQYFQQVLESLGMPPHSMNNFAPYRPWLAGISIQALYIKSEGGDPEAGVDKTLWHKASEQGKKLRYFETLEEQLAFFSSLSPKEELLFFEEGIKQIIEQPELLNQIVNDWQQGNTEALGEKINQTLGVHQAGLYNKLLVERNKSWAVRINELMKGSGTIFVAVGAGHLAGPGSLQDQLKTLGFMSIRQ